MRKNPPWTTSLAPNPNTYTYILYTFWIYLISHIAKVQNNLPKLVGVYLTDDESMEELERMLLRNYIIFLCNGKTNNKFRNTYYWVIYLNILKRRTWGDKGNH